MAVWFQAGLMVLAVLFTAGCGSEDHARPGQSHSSGVTVEQPDRGNPGNDPDDGSGEPVPNPPEDPEQPPVEEPPVEEPPVEEPPVEEPPVDEPPVDPPVEEPEPPLQVNLDDNVFFPIIPGLLLYFDNNPVPTVLGAGQPMGTDLAYPLQHDNLLSNYFTSTAAHVGLKSMHVLVFEHATQQAYLDLVFNDSRPILGDVASYNTTGSAVIRVTGVPIAFRFPVRLTATLAANEWVTIAGLAPQPARRIEISQRLAPPLWQRLAILLAYPWLAPIFDPVTYSLQLVPGIGVVGVQMGNLSTEVRAVAGVPEPMVFAVDRNGSTGSPQPLLVAGEAVTDMDWTTSIHYRTTGSDWLAVAFDSSGSWRARVTRTDLPTGIYAATVRFSRGEDIRDVTVSLMVE